VASALRSHRCSRGSRLSRGKDFHRFDADGLIEEGDPQAREFPRLKLSDDATAVAFEITID